MRYVHRHTCVQDCSSVTVTYVYMQAAKIYSHNGTREEEKNYKLCNLFFFVATAPNGPGPPHHEVSRTHTATHHSR